MPDLVMRNFARAGRWLEPFLFRKSYPNFFWSVLWQFTTVCNARCLYCSLEKVRAHPDVFGVLQRVKALRPKDVLLMGGEPYVYPEIVALLKAIKSECGAPYLTISTNLAVDVERVLESLPLLDQIQVSIDGMGEINKTVRCHDGDEIGKRIRTLRDEIDGRRLPVNLFTHSVVTTHSVDGIEDFVEGMQSSCPGLKMGFSLVEPYGHALSIAYDRDRLRGFVATIIRLKGKGYPVNICDRMVNPHGGGGMPVSSNFESHYDADCVIAGSVKCRRQFFFAFVTPHGDVITCHPKLFYDRYKACLKELILGRRYVKAAGVAARMLDQLLIRRYEPSCHFPCKCQRFIEDVLESRRRKEITPEIERIAHKFSRGEIELAQGFLKKRYGDFLPPGVVERLLSERGGA